MYKLNRIFSNEEGSGLVLALMVLLVLSVLGSALGMVTINSHRLADHTQDTNSAYYIAEAGANLAYSEIEDYTLMAYKNSESQSTFFTKMSTPLGEESNLETRKYNEFKDNSGNKLEAIVTIMPGEERNNVKEFRIRSVGAVAGKTRVVEKKISLTWKDKSEGGGQLPLLLGDAAITVNGKFFSEQWPTVNGYIYMTNIGFVDIQNKNKKENFPGDNKTEIISDIKWEELSKVNVDIPEIPKVSFANTIKNIDFSGGEKTVQLSEDSYLEKLTINNGGKLTIDTTGKDLILVVDKLSLNNTSDINVVSGGKLTIYYTGNDVLTTQNGFKYNGSLISANSGITGKGYFNVTGDVIASGNVNLENNPVIKGNVVANGYIKIHGATVNGDVIAGGYIEFSNKPVITGRVMAKGSIEMDNPTVNGIIISLKDITFKNESKLVALVMVPNGKFTLGSQSTLKGSLVAKEISFKSNTTITHSTDYLEYLQGGTGNGDSSETNIDDLLKTEPAIEQ